LRPQTRENRETKRKRNSFRLFKMPSTKQLPQFRWRFLFAILLCLSFLSNNATTATDIKWTPNEDAENVALPLSMKQRQQLVQLENAIQQSLDPQATLEQVAESNNMSPQELVNMLDKNSRDLQQNPSLAQPSTLPKTILKLVASLGVVVSQMAKKHPQSFSLIAASLLVFLYAMVAIPRTGMMISSSRGMLSKGPTTVFSPPTKYLSKLVDSPRMQERPVSTKTKKTKWDDLFLTQDDDVVFVHKLQRNHELSQAVTAQVSLNADALLEEFAAGASNDNEEEDDDEETDNKRNQVLELMFEHAATVLSTRQFSEFASQPPLRYVASGDARQKYGILLVKGLGDWGRYGLVYLQVSRQEESDVESTITLSTVKGGNIFDGQIHLSVQKHRQKVVVRAHVVVPKRGKRLSKTIARNIVEALTNSIVTSAQRRTQQTLARQSQSSRFKGKAHSRATERRTSRSEKVKDMEEMAVDRRRRWQRSNPNSGRYTPSGDRQRSPNNC
jgi:hypothetical protein